MKKQASQSPSRQVIPDFTVTYFLTQAETSALVKQGIWADDVRKIARSMSIERGRIAAMLGIPGIAVASGGQRKQLLSPAHARRLVGLGKLAGLLQALVARSGDSNNFNAMHWLAHWLLHLPRLPRRLLPGRGRLLLFARPSIGAPLRCEAFSCAQLEPSFCTPTTTTQGIHI